MPPFSLGDFWVPSKAFLLEWMALTQTLTVPWRLGWEEDGKGKVQCEQKQNSSLEKSSACKNTEIKNTDDEQ